MKQNKILLLLFLLFVFFDYVNAEQKEEIVEQFKKDNLNITNDAIVKFKWYKLYEYNGTYYEKGENLDGYFEDENRIIYGNYTNWDYNYCKYSRDNYVVESQNERIYKKIVDTQYVKFINFKFDNNIRIFNNTEEIEFEVVRQSDNEVFLNLGRLYEVSNILLYVDSDESYDIYFYFDRSQTMLSLSKKNEKSKIIIPDASWIKDNSTYATEYTHTNYLNNEFKTYQGLRPSCRVKPIKTYRYKLNKRYYDEEYHEYVEGYVPDLDDYLVEYISKLPTNNVFITEIKKEFVPIDKYIYLDSEKIKNTGELNIQKDEECSSEPIVETKYIENEVIKKIYAIPKKIYLILLILILIILLEAIKLSKRNVD